MKDKIFFSIVFGFIFGVLLCSLFTINFYVAVLLCVISFGIILFYKFLSHRRSRTTGSNKWGMLAGIFVLAFSFGIFRFNIAENNISIVLDSWSGREIQAGQSVSLSGMISDEPQIKENNQKLIVEVGDKRDLRILVTTDFNEEYRYGDIVNFYGRLEMPENFTTDTGKEFDYINYLKKDGILFVMTYPKIEISTRDNGN